MEGNEARASCLIAQTLKFGLFRCNHPPAVEVLRLEEPPF